jgi:hypothetical protein
MKKLLTGTVVAAALLLMLSGCGNQAAVSSKAISGSSVSGSIEDLVKLGKNYKCDLQFKNGDQILAGTTYLAGGSARSDFQMKAGDKTVTGHFIMNSQWMYTWTDGTPNQAVKFSVQDLKKFQGQTEQASPSAGNYQAKYDYKCYSWTPDQSKFTPPTDVNFTDYSALLKQLPGEFNNLKPSTPPKTNVNTNPGSNLCASCDAIPDANSKALCRQQMNCK